MFFSYLNLAFRNLPEVRSAHEILGVPTVSARFGTAPFFWNWGMSAIAKFVPVVCYGNCHYYIVHSCSKLYHLTNDMNKNDGIMKLILFCK